MLCVDWPKKKKVIERQESLKSSGKEPKPSIISLNGSDGGSVGRVVVSNVLEVRGSHRINQFFANCYSEKTKIKKKED